MDIDRSASLEQQLIREQKIRTLKKLLVKEPEAVSASLNAATPVLYFEKVWETRPFVADIQEPAPTAVVVFADNPKCAEALAAHWAKSSEISRRVVAVVPGPEFRQVSTDHFEVNPADAQNIAKLFELLEHGGEAPSCYIFNGLASACGPASTELLERHLYTPFHVAQELLQQYPNQKFRLITLQGDIDLSEDPEHRATFAAASGGFWRSLSKENPRMRGNVVHIPSALAVDEASLANIIGAEMTRDTEAVTDVSYRSGQRQLEVWRELLSPPVDNRGPTFQRDAVYLIVGGLGGLGALLATHLALSVGARVALIGRSPLSDMSVTRLTQWRQRGGSVAYFQADVADIDSLGTALIDINAQLGPVNGVFHCAGVVKDAFLLRKSRADVATVIAAKVNGIIALDTVTRRQPLDFFTAFSSTSAALGNPGQTDYAYANAFIDAFCQQRADAVQKGNRVGHTVAINWPFWEQGGMQIRAEILDVLKQRFGLTSLDAATGLAALTTILALPTSKVMALAGIPDTIRSWLTPADAALAAPDEKVWPPVSVDAQAYLKTVLAHELGYNPTSMRANSRFEEFGIDSIKIVKLNRALERDLGQLSKTLFFEYQTLGELADYLQTHYAKQLTPLLGSSLKTTAAVKSTAAPSSATAGSRFWRRANADGLQSSEQTPHTDDGDIAIIGVAGRYPQSRTLAQFWDNLKAGKDCIVPLPHERWVLANTDIPEPKLARWGGFIDGVDEFDPLFFNISPRDAKYIDPQERLFLQTAYHAIEDAGYSRARLNPLTVGVYVGVMWGEYQLIEDGRGFRGAVSYGAIANRLSYFLNLHGPSLALDTMCSSSLTAIHLACQSIRLGECDMAIAGGVNISVHPNKFVTLEHGKFAASDGRCRSFGEGGDGYVPGEGVGAVLLKSRQQALKDGDPIHGIIKGSAVNHGGRTNGFSVPNPVKQGELIATALKRAQVDPRSMSYLEAHGTGTALGDPIEINGLMRALRPQNDSGLDLAIGSVKSNIGHLESAAGIAGITKVLLQMRHRQLVPSLHSLQLNQQIAWDKVPFRVQQSLSPWVSAPGDDTPRRAGVSSFGAGGSNAHVVLEECPDQRVESDTPDAHVIVLSAHTDAALSQIAVDLLEWLDSRLSAADKGDIKARSELRLSRIGYTLQTGRTPLPQRWAVIVTSIDELRARLKTVVASVPVRGGFATTEFQGDPASPETAQLQTLHELATQWIRGEDVSWHGLYAAVPRRVSLPGYPFAQESYWVPHQRYLAWREGSMDGSGITTQRWQGPHLVVFAADSEGALSQQIEAVLQETSLLEPYADTCVITPHALAQQGSVRLAIIAHGAQEAREQLVQFMEGAESTNVVFGMTAQPDTVAFFNTELGHAFLRNVAARYDWAKLAELWVSGVAINGQQPVPEYLPLAEAAL